MWENPKTKIVGKRCLPATAEAALRQAHVLEVELDRLNPYPRPRGFVKKFKSYDDYELWKKSQSNPRLW